MAQSPPRRWTRRERAQVAATLARTGNAEREAAPPPPPPPPPPTDNTECCTCHEVVQHPRCWCAECRRPLHESNPCCLRECVRGRCGATVFGRRCMDNHPCAEHEDPLYWIGACPPGQGRFLGLWQCSSWENLSAHLIQGTGLADISGFLIWRLSETEASQVAAGWRPSFVL